MRLNWQNVKLLILRGGKMEIDRKDNYDKSHCWQYDIRLKNKQEDIINSGFSETYLKELRVSDFDFKLVENKQEKEKIIEFIIRHEWLGNISQYTTHWFACYHKDILAGALLFNMPNAFSKYLGENTKDLERLISRGACISWSPKNLASSFIMWAIDYMTKNTQYRIFTAYSDPMAKELGTIYQACGFYYMGESFGAKKRYINPYTGKIVSDRYFRQKTAYKKFAKDMGIEWCENWNHKTGMLWENVPNDIEEKLREYSKSMQKKSDVIEVPSKHKYAYIKGVDKRETKQLRAIFLDRNKVFDYPKER